MKKYKTMQIRIDNNKKGAVQLMYSLLIECTKFSKLIIRMLWFKKNID